MIVLKDVSIGHKDKIILNNINSCFEKGKFISILGKNGCGKSTLLKTVLGSIPLKSGEVFFDEANSKELSSKKRAQKISFLSQNTNTLDITVFQLVLHGRFPYLNFPRIYSKKDIEIVNESLEKMNIGHLKNKLLKELSGGECQKAYIAMIIAQQTDYIMLDEPTTWLDITFQIELMNILLDLKNENKGIIIVMHDILLALEYSDKFYVVNEDKLLAFENSEEVLKSKILKKVFDINIDFIENSKSKKKQYLLKF